MSKYECYLTYNEHRSLLGSCPFCIESIRNRHDRMLEYIRKVIEDAKISENYHRADEALEVLKEIGKL
jgi:maltooligosyltrehalose synthase